MLHTPTSQPLFIRHKSAAELLEKQAAAVARMPDDDKRWPAQVLSEMHKQLPFLSKFDVDIEMTRIEPEAGYALGYAMLRNKTGKQRAAEELGKPTNKIRVPVIVADRLLQPFHVFEVGGKTYPLTQERVESAMMNPSMFDGISDPPGTQSLLDQIYPPFQHRQGYGMMSGDRATTGLSKLSSAPRVTKTASGEPGPLREFLRRTEVEKTAIFTPQAVTAGVPGAAKSFGNLVNARLAGKVVSRVPPVRPAAPTVSVLRGGRNTVISHSREGVPLASVRNTARADWNNLHDLPGSYYGRPIPPPAGSVSTDVRNVAAASESVPAGLASMNDPARSAFLNQHRLNPNISPTGLAQLEHGFGQWSAAPGNAGKSFQDYVSSLPQQRSGFFGIKGPSDAVARAPEGKAAPGFLGSTVGGATMLGLGAVGGGMMMANKASENY